MVQNRKTTEARDTRKLDRIKRRLQSLYADAGDYAKIDDINWLVGQVERLEARLADCRQAKKQSG